MTGTIWTLIDQIKVEHSDEENLYSVQEIKQLSSIIYLQVLTPGIRMVFPDSFDFVYAARMLRKHETFCTYFL